MREQPQPFLLQASLGDVRLALEAHDDELAAAVLRAAMDRGDTFEADCPECNYLLGVIEERQGAMGKAIVAFENAVHKEWLLKRDALLHLVRLELLRKNCTRASELLEQAGAPDPEDPAAEVLAAQTELCGQNWEKGAGRLRHLITTTTDEDRRAKCQVVLAQALVERARLGQLDARVAEEEAIVLAQKALSQLAPSSGHSERARRLLDELLAGYQRIGGGDDHLNERLLLLEASVEARRWSEARQLGEEILSQLAVSTEQSQSYCRVMFANGRIAAATSNRKSALDAFDWVGGNCDDADLAARALFMRAGQHSAAGERTEAIQAYAELERRFRSHRLADDARLKQAILYRAVGSDSQFVSLLDAMPDDYPDGDMVLEGMFQLALKNMLQRNWPAALAVLERSERISASMAQAKDVEIDRQKYFLGRASIEAGKVDSGTNVLRELVVRRPLTYYMLLAYSVLVRMRPEVAAESLHEGVSTSGAAPLLGGLGERDQRRVERLLALLGVGDVKVADHILQEPGTRQICEGALFTIAAMFANAGATKTAVSLVKSRGRDWRVRWPSAGWADLWKQAYPRPYRELVVRESAKNGIGESLIYAVMREESEFDPKAVSPADAYGLMQLIVPTARAAGRELGIAANPKSLQRPGINIALGTKVLAKLMDRFQGQVALVAAGYNAGPGRPARWLREYPEVDLDLWIELIEYAETRGYVKRVLQSQATYHWLYGEDGEAGTKLEVLPGQLRAGRAG